LSLIKVDIFEGNGNNMQYLKADSGEEATPLWLVTEQGLEQFLSEQPARVSAWVAANGFKAKAGSHLVVPDQDGAAAGVIVGTEPDPDIWCCAGLPTALGRGVFRVETELSQPAATGVALGWLLGTYCFDRYRDRSGETCATLLAPATADMARAAAEAEAIFLVRDLVNTPTADLGPTALAAATVDLAGQFGATVAVTVGDDLLAENYPMIHAVGRASVDQPRLIDLIWGKADDPRITLVGKGVCFDSGGLDLKPASAMLLMKKDMGGAANVLGLARMIMALQLPVRLRVLIPAVENAVSGNAFRPGDILASRKGLSVEIGNTDAEGRLVLADALCEADGEKPAMLIDMATLTGAARVALGVELAGAFTPDDGLAADLARHADVAADPVWRLPLWQPYRRNLDSKPADINNVGDGPHGGAITAALFLKEFVTETKAWLHFDIMAWNTRARPGRPIGGEAFAIRALYGLLEERYGGK